MGLIMASADAVITILTKFPDSFDNMSIKSAMMLYYVISAGLEDGRIDIQKLVRIGLLITYLRQSLVSNYINMCQCLTIIRMPIPYTNNAISISI